MDFEYEDVTTTSNVVVNKDMEEMEELSYATIVAMKDNLQGNVVWARRETHFLEEAPIEEVQAEILFWNVVILKLM